MGRLDLKNIISSRKILFALILSLPLIAYGVNRIDDMVVSGSVKIGGTAVANSKAALEIASTTKGILLPRMTATQRDAIATPPEGLFLYDTVAHEMNIYNGTGWKAVFDAANISGVLSGSVIPPPAIATLGGIFSHAAVSNNFLTAVLTDGTITNARPACATLSDSAASCATDATNASNIGSGTLAVARGGTGQTSVSAAFNALSPLTTAGDMLSYGAGTNSRIGTSAGDTGKPFISGGASVPNFWATLGVVGGGTGAATLSNHGVVLGQGTSAVAVTSAGTAGQVLTSGGASADPSWTTNVFPSTAAAGSILNASSANTFVATVTPTLGVAGASTGKLNLTGVTSGTITIQPQSAAGTYNWNLPTTAGTAGQVLTSGGGSSSPMTWVTAGANAKVLFTADGTFTVPAGTLSTTVFKFIITASGGGGGGAATGIGATGGGGAAGSTAIKWLTGLTAGNTIAVTIGAAGTAGVNSGGTGGTGGNAVIASGTETITTVTALGGLGGVGNTGTTPVDGGVGRSNTNADVDLMGGDGGCSAGTSTGFSGGIGGASFWGGGGGGAAQGGPGKDGKAYGSGGGGGSTNAGTQPGGAGKKGIVTVEYTL